MSDEEKNAIKELDIFVNSRTDMKCISSADLKIIYNLVKKQETEIDRLIEVKCYTESEAIKLLKENIKLNKMIDEMAQTLLNYGFVLIKSKKGIIEFFRKKVENEQG